MIGVIVSGHGNFATGITSALNLILGNQDNYKTVDFPESDTATELENNIKNAIQSLNHCEQIIIFCDLLSGSPFNISIMEAMKNENIKVIYGTNLGMLIESMMKRNMGVEFDNIVNEAIEIGQTQIGLFTVVQDEEDDPFE